MNRTEVGEWRIIGGGRNIEGQKETRDKGGTGIESERDGGKGNSETKRDAIVLGRQSRGTDNAKVFCDYFNGQRDETAERK